MCHVMILMISLYIVLLSLWSTESNADAVNDSEALEVTNYKYDPQVADLTPVTLLPKVGPVIILGFM